MNEEERESQEWFFIESDRNYNSRRFRYFSIWIFCSIGSVLVTFSSFILIFSGGDRNVCGILLGILLLLFMLLFSVGIYIMNSYPVRIRICKDYASLPSKENKLKLFVRFESKSVAPTSLRIVSMGGTFKGDIRCNVVYLYNEKILDSAFVRMSRSEFDQFVNHLGSASFPSTFV